MHILSISCCSLIIDNNAEAESAADQNKDPVDFRMQIFEPRAAVTLAKAASMAGWGNAPAEGRARGVAYLERGRTLSSGICEISIDEQTGKIKGHHFWSAHDSGIVIQPDSIIAQSEGGVVMGLYSVLDEKIDIVNGVVQQYPVRHRDCMKDEVVVVEQVK